MEGGGVWLASNKIEGFRKDERLAFLDDILDPESTWVLGFAHTQEKVWTPLLSAAILATAEHVCHRGGLPRELVHSYLGAASEYHRCAHLTWTIFVTCFALHASLRGPF